MADPPIALPEAPAPAAPPPATVAPNAIPSGHVAVFNPDGKLVSISAADLPSARAAGYEVASNSALHQRSPTTLYDVGQGLYDTGEAIESGVHGVLRGATAGLSDVAGKKLRDWTEGADAGEQFASDLARLKSEHPIISSGSELTGMVGGALAGSGAGMAGKATLGAFGEAGALAEGAVGRLTGGLASRGALGKAASSAIGMGVRGAVETGAYSGTSELSEEMLGKPELSGEKIWAATAGGAEGGLLFGGILGGAGSLAGSAVGAAKDFASGVISRNADKLEGLANEQRWRALDPLKKFTQQAEARVEGGVEGVGEVLKKYDIVPKDIAGAAREGGIDAIGPKIDAAVDTVGKQLGDLTGASTGTVTFSKIHDALDAVIDPLRKVAGREGVVSSLENYQASLARKLVPETEDLITRRGAAMSNEDFAALNNRHSELMQTPITLQDALFQRKGLDQMVYQEAKSLDPHMRVQVLRDFRAKFEGLIVDAFDDAAKAAGNAEAKGQLLTLKRDYQALSLAQDAAEQSTSRMATNRNLSMSDYISGGIGSNIGKAVGGTLLGAPGAFLGGLAGGAVGSAVNKFGRDRGNAIAAAALDKAGQFARARQAIAKVDQSLEKAATGLVEGPRGKPGTPYRSLPATSEETAQGPLRARFDRMRKAVVDLQSQGDEVAKRAMQPMAHMPQVGQAVGRAAMRTAAYLSAQLPAAAVPPTLGYPMPTRVSEPDMSAFIEKARVANDPQFALKAFASGKITTNMASALKAVSPEMFADLQSKAMDMVIQRQAKGDPLPFDARQRMSILLGIITDPSQDPKMVAMLQGNLQPDPQQGGGPGAPSPKAPKGGPGAPVNVSKLDKLEES